MIIVLSNLLFRTHLVGDQVSGEILRCVYTADDECSPKVRSTEKLQEARSSRRLLVFDDPSHHGHGLCRVDPRFATETLNGPRGLFVSALPDKPPRAFWREKEEDSEGSWEEPLQSNWNPIRMGAKARQLPSFEHYGRQARATDRYAAGSLRSL